MKKNDLDINSINFRSLTLLFLFTIILIQVKMNLLYFYI